MPPVNKISNKPTPKNIGGLPSAWDFEPGLKVLLYGKSGTGKTTLWGTFPGPTLALICSGSRKPGELRSIDTPENRKKITPLICTKYEHVKELVERAKSGEWKTIVVDHASGLQDIILMDILGIDEMPAQKSWGLASQQQYGQCTLQCKEILRSIIGIPNTNTVIIAHERNFEEGSKKTDDSESSDRLEVIDPELYVPFIGAALSPSLTGWLNGAMNIVCQTMIRQKTEEKTIPMGKEIKKVIQQIPGVDYCLRTKPSPVYMSKFRVANRGENLPKFLVNPTYEKLLKLHSGEKV